MAETQAAGAVMGLYTIECPSCKKPHQWFSGHADQRCFDCINEACKSPDDSSRPAPESLTTRGLREWWLKTVGYQWSCHEERPEQQEVAAGIKIGEVIHVIEKSAFDKLQAELEKTKGTAFNLVSKVNERTKEKNEAQARVRELEDQLQWSLKKETQLKEQLFTQTDFDKKRIAGLEAELEKTKHALRLTGEGRPSEWAYTQLLNDFKKLETERDAFKYAHEMRERDVDGYQKQVAELKLRPILGCDAQCVAIQKERDALQSRLAEKSADNIKAYAEIGVLQGRLAEYERKMDETVDIHTIARLKEKLAAAEETLKSQASDLKYLCDAADKTISLTKQNAELLQWCERLAINLKSAGELLENHGGKGFIGAALETERAKTLAEFKSWREKNK